MSIQLRLYKIKLTNKQVKYIYSAQTFDYEGNKRTLKKSDN